jgi:hypothetical protein
VLVFEQILDKNYFMYWFLTIKYFKVAKINDLKIEYSDDWGGH